MKRIYCDEILVPKTEDGKHLISNIHELFKISKKVYDENQYNELVIGISDDIRKLPGFPNKIFTIVTCNGDNDYKYALFPKEPDGKIYTPYLDEDAKNIYIEVE